MRLHDLLVLRSASKKRELRAEPKLRRWRLSDGIFHAGNNANELTLYRRRAELRRRISVTITSDRVDCAAIGRGQFAMHSANSRDFFRELIRAHEIARVSERNPQVS